jgi:cell wall-associated NlpC family hydrolase
MTRLSLILLLLTSFASTALTQTKEVPPVAAVSTIEAAELKEYATLTEPVRATIDHAIALTKMNLTYTFSSSDPKAGGMDCSGTIYHLLRECGYKTVPRQSDQICKWIMSEGQFHSLKDATGFDAPAFSALRPGDLVFWSGTYEATKRELPITHVMMYLGTRAKDGRRVLFGASDGRTYEGQRRTGVSVFDFAIPKRDSKAQLYGYGSLPEAKRK